MLQPLLNAPTRAWVPPRRAAPQGPRRVWHSPGNGVRVDETKGALRALLRRVEHPREVRQRGDRLRGEGEDEEDEWCEEQTASSLGAYC